MCVNGSGRRRNSFLHRSNLCWFSLFFCCCFAEGLWVRWAVVENDTHPLLLLLYVTQDCAVVDKLETRFCPHRPLCKFLSGKLSACICSFFCLVVQSGFLCLCLSLSLILSTRIFRST